MARSGATSRQPHLSSISDGEPTSERGGPQAAADWSAAVVTLSFTIVDNAACLGAGATVIAAANVARACSVIVVVVVIIIIITTRVTSTKSVLFPICKGKST